MNGPGLTDSSELTAVILVFDAPGFLLGYPADIR